MPIKVGDRLPDAKFQVMTTEGQVWKTTDEVFKGRRVALFAVPGAFTPTCNNLHIPSFLNNAAAIKAKGVHTIAVTGVNDVFVMEAWKKSTGAEGKIDFLADGNGEFAKAIDMAFDGSGNGLGTRSKRYSMLVDDGVVKKLNIEDAPGKCEISGGRPCWGSSRSSQELNDGRARPGHFVFRPLFCLHRACCSRARRDKTFASEFVCAFVLGVAGMALDPVPMHIVMAERLIKPLP